MAAAAVERPGAPPPPQQRYQGVQKESAGYRLLSAMGWKEGEGLGASKQGIKSHIKVKKKFENWGVGAIEAAEHAQNWTNGMLDFHRVLSNLSEVVSEHAKKRASGSGSGSSSSGSDSGSESDSDSGSDSDAKRGGKKRKAASSSGSGSSSSKEEAAAADAAPRRVRAATHIGRFKKREAAKMVKGYSEHDLAAILGADPFAAAAAAVPEVRAQRAPSSSGYDSDSEPSEGEEEAGSGGKREKRQRQQKEQGVAKKAKGGKAAAPPPPQEQQQQQQQAPAARPDMIVVRRPMRAACRPPAPPTPQESRQPGWWQVCFHRAAGPGGAQQVQRDGLAPAPGADAATINVHGFSEQDQTNLYNLAHDKATQGRVGLGRSSMPKKVAGARWEGKRTRIENSDDDEDEEAEGEGGWQRQQGPEVGPAPAGVELEREEGLVIILPASKRHLLDALPDCQAQQAQQAGAAQQQAAAEPAQVKAGGKKGKKAKKAAAAAAEQQAAAGEQQAAGVASIPWKKAVGAALAASGKASLKLSKLHRAVAKAQGVPKAQRGAALEGLTAYLRSPKCTKFVLEDGAVRRA